MSYGSVILVHVDVVTADAKRIIDQKKVHDIGEKTELFATRCVSRLQIEEWLSFQWLAMNRQKL